MFEMFTTIDWANFGLWWVVLALVVIGMAGTVVPAVPGLPLIFAACLLAAWMDDFEAIGFFKLSLIHRLNHHSFLFSYRFTFAYFFLGDIGRDDDIKKSSEGKRALPDNYDLI